MIEPTFKTHALKIWKQHFEDVQRGDKRSEVRLDDRGYAIGDNLRLKEYDPLTQMFTGRETLVRVTHILRGGEFGIAPGYVVLSIARPILGAAE